MLDLDRLRINVTSGRYVVDAHAVADALLSHAGIMSAPQAGDAGRRDAARAAVSPAGARSPQGPPPARPGC